MIINELFEYGIDRYINPVVKVQQDDLKVVKTELREYVLTEQLKGHYKECFYKFLNDRNKVGIWASGWFGSGKSAFAKTFGYILENHQLDDCSAADIFLRKDVSNELKPIVDEINAKYNTKVVMFDILEEAGKGDNKVEPIEMTIYKQYLKKRGFYTSQLWIAELEKELVEQGKYDDFINTVEDISKKKWEDIRKSRLGVTNIQRALTRVLPDQIPTETIAKDYVNDLKASKTLSVSDLANELMDYINSMDKVDGKENRLFIIVDEIGQYISTNPDVIGYLQAIESTFARIGKGQLWLCVTSQNQLQQITEGYLKSQDEINKVIDRFEVRVHLTPDNLDRVINERVLKKNSKAVETVSKLYESNKGRLTAILDLKDNKKILVKSGKEDFVETYPFLPYQIKLIQPIYYNVISKSSANKKLGGTNRSMIKATQGILVDNTINFQNKSIGSFVTLDMFFDQAKEFIDDQMQMNIKDAKALDSDKGDLLVKILKVLYLLNNDDNLYKNVETISKLLVEDITEDYFGFEKKIQEGLDILFKHGYVEKDLNGNYKFISPEEQSFRQEAIARMTEISMRDMSRTIKGITDEFFKVNKINYKNIRVFDINIEIDDEKRYSSSSRLFINLNTPMQAGDEYRIKRNEAESLGKSDTLYWYSQFDSSIDDEVKQYLVFSKIIEEYRRKWSSDEEKVHFLRKEEVKNNNLFENIRRKISKSFINGFYIYQGKKVKLPNKTDLRDVFEYLGNLMVPNVYTQFNTVGVKITKENIVDFFKGNQLSLGLNELNLIQDTNINAESTVLKEILNEIKGLNNKFGVADGKKILDIFTDIPYGWATDAIRLFSALLFKNGNIELTYEGREFVDYNQSGVKEIFEQDNNYKKAIFKPAVVVDASTRQKAQDILQTEFSQNSSDTIAELYRNIREILINIRNDISSKRTTVTNYKLPLGTTLSKLDQDFKQILNSKTQGELINKFVSNREIYKEGYSKFLKLKKFIGDDKGTGYNNVNEYNLKKIFLKDIWAVESDINSTTYELDKRSVDEIISLMDSDNFIEYWTVIREKYDDIYNPYIHEYKELHIKLYNLYITLINEMKNNRTYNSIKSDERKNQILKIYYNNVCDNMLSNELPCHKCRRSMKDMKNIIQYIDSVKDKAMDLLYEYLNKQIEEEQIDREFKKQQSKPKITTKISTKDFPSGMLIQSHKDLKSYLKRIEEILLKEISNGNDIMIEK